MAAPPVADPRNLIPMIGYARVSYVGGRDEILSPDIQKQTGNEWAPRNGYRIVRWIVDLDETGRNFDRDVADAIAAVVAGEAVAIGVFNYSRWGRDTRDCLNYLKEVSDIGGDVISWTEPFDAQTAIGIFSRTMAFAIAELQSRQIGEGWERAHANRVSRGLPGSGAARFGYVRLGRIPDETRPRHYRRDPDDPEGERYVPDPDTGPVLADLYRRYAAGEPVSRLVYWLNVTGIPTVTGGQWTRYTLRQVLITGFGAGLLRIHDPACRIKPGRGRAKCGRYVYVPGTQKPVITEGEWRAFLDRLAQRAATPPRLRDAVYPFSGLLWCGDAGHRLSVVTNGGGIVGYRCTRKMEARNCPGAYVREVVVEERVLGWLSQWAADIEAAAAVSAAREGAVHRAQADLETLAKREAVLQNSLARLMRRWVSDENMEEAAYQKARAPYLAELEAVRARMAAATQTGKVNAGAWQPLAVGLIAEWPLFSPARRRLMLGELISRIEVYRAKRGQPPRLEIIPVWEA